MQLAIKRIWDISLAVVLLVVLAPLFLIIGLAVKIGSSGPAMFTQDRLTRGGKVFRIYKFRTMVEGAERIGTGLYSFRNDPRITRVGRILRATSLDELPQLINILRGDMSFVGPRPPVVYELGDYRDLNDEYKRRFVMPAGVTGLAQIEGRNEIPWEIKIKYDNRYIELFQRYGVLADIGILALTFVRVFSGKGVNEEIPDELHVGAGMPDEEYAKSAAQRLVEAARRKKPEGD